MTDELTSQADEIVLRLDTVSVRYSSQDRVLSEASDTLTACAVRIREQDELIEEIKAAVLVEQEYQDNRIRELEAENAGLKEKLHASILMHPEVSK